MNKDQLRASQLVTTFGPGAMVDLPTASVIIAGLDHWNYDPAHIPNVNEARLTAKICRVLGRNTVMLRRPPPANDMPQGFHPGITGWRFPEWFIVQNPLATQSGARRRRLVHLNSLDRGKFRDENDKRHAVVPIRFVRACKRGHIGDIDWKAFVHGTGSPCVRNLWIEERGTSGDLDEIWIVCECGKPPRAMSQAARQELIALGHCDGSRPWLGRGTKEKCGLPNRLLIRSASNAFFPQLMSVISIPDSRTPVDQVVREAWGAGLSIVNSREMLATVRQIPNVAAMLAGLDDDTVWEAIQRVRSGSDNADRPVKEVEFDALASAAEELGSDVLDGDFFARRLPASQWQAPWMDAIDRVVLVHRLREVVALLGFTRFDAAGPDIQGELELEVERAPLAIDTTWLPAIENLGEGIFLLFKNTVVQEWLQRPEVQKRGRELSAGFEFWKKDHAASHRVFPGMAFYMLHSVAHLLITAMSLECGYPASSLRERIYAAPDRYGILIYTGSSDAEGTLGGLIEAGREIRKHMRRAIEIAALCSNDPVCAHHSPSEHDQQPLLGSACHGCLLIAETSCEQHNDFLDRGCVVSTVEGSGAEFFAIS
jgi:hypothetical protein